MPEVVPAHVSHPYNQTEAYYVGAFSFVLVLLLQIYLRNKYSIPLKNDEYGMRILSLFHSLVSTFVGAYAAWAHTGGDYPSPATRFEANLHMFSCTYFIADMIVMVMWKFDLVYFAHHIPMIGGTMLPAFFGTFGYTITLSFICGEMSNPFLHGRWLLLMSGVSRRSLFCKVTTYCFFVTFFVGRYLWSPWLIYKVALISPMVLIFAFSAVVVFSWKFLIDAIKAELKGEKWDED